MMTEPLNTFNSNPLGSNERAELIEKCQHNGWLMRGGQAYQDDPFLEEYPYEFALVEQIDDLREFFRQGNWSIRQGIVYKDIAFIQQVDGGDEWWTLKKTNEGWLDFESLSFENLVKEPERFNHLICSLVASSPESCKKLDYLFPQDTTDRLVAIAEEFGYWDVSDDHPNPDDLRTYIIHSLENTPEDVRDWLQSINEETQSTEALLLAQQVSALHCKDSKQEPLSPAAPKENAMRATAQQSASNQIVQKAR